MSRLPLSPLSLLLATALGGIASAQVTFTVVPGATSATDITPDGTVVVGTLNGLGGYYWRWKQDPAPISIGGITAVGVSDDGSVIAGNVAHSVTGENVAAVWTQATGWQELGGVAGTCSGTLSSAYDISGDGTTVVGLGWNGCTGAAFSATYPFMTGLQTLGSGGNRASAIARDGSKIGGFAQGTFSRSPAVWFPDASGFAFDMNEQGEVHGFSDDGSTVLGEWINAAGTNIDAFYWPDWENDLAAKQNFVNLGSLHLDWNGNAVDMAEPVGASSVPPMIVGYDSQGLGADAWVWTPANGIEHLQTKLMGMGVPSVPELGYCEAITPDGKTIVGHTTFGGAWIVDFPTPGQVAVLGCGVNPAGSMTVVSGLPEIGKTLTLGLDNPIGSQSPGALPFVVLATAPSLAYPCGSSLPGFGMSGPGELLIDIVPPNPISPAIGGAPWAGAGSPASVQLSFPTNPNLIGKTLYGQGVLLDFSPLSMVPVGLTDAVEMLIGG